MQGPSEQRTAGLSGQRSSIDATAAAEATQAATAAEPGARRAYWREDLAPYAQAHMGRSLRELATSVLPYLGLSVLMYECLSISYLLVLAIAVPAAGFLVRTFILFHDCTHGSLLRSKR
ncbi:MAG TPA: hypothetical protein VH025_10290, partial [Solirubrobacteraceae bacterium]|nr:hypothetical protein [Solirubrobacteraceae bacterium]